MNIQELAKKALSKFEQRTRVNGHMYWCHTSSEQWLDDLCHDAHDDFGPDDYRYQFIVEALQAISDGDTDGETLEPTAYTGERTAWLASNLQRVGYCDECVSDYGHAKSLNELLGWGMQREMTDVFESVKASLEKELNK